MAREALVLDSNDEMARQLVSVLAENGYVVRVITTKQRAKLFEKSPVYIHLIDENYDKIIREIDFSHIEIAVFASPNDMLNLTLAKAARSQGVPMVIITARGSAIIKEAEEAGVQVIVPYHCVISRLLRMLNLKFTKIYPLRGEISMLEMLVTSDSHLLGRTICDVEEEIGGRVAVIREDQIITAGEAEIQEGDYVIAIGYQTDLQKITE
ncbi:MAG: TrkA C-terminal domain-containing protein [Pyrobaculum sp.]|uniref:TrkA C-terminal domain-containing protein n=1 Tax=Pyrobaculum sp. TaxID=2004705 RepID=UPI00316A0EEC